MIEDEVCFLALASKYRPIIKNEGNISAVSNNIKLESKIIWNVPSILEIYATSIPIVYITSILRFLWKSPVSPALTIG